MLLRAAQHGKRKKQFILWFDTKDTPENPSQLARTPQKLKERKKRLLQLHDQKIEGILGLTPLYIGLKGRVTEKICMGNR